MCVRSVTHSECNFHDVDVMYTASVAISRKGIATWNNSGISTPLVLCCHACICMGSNLFIIAKMSAIDSALFLYIPTHGLLVVITILLSSIAFC